MKKSVKIVLSGLGILVLVVVVAVVVIVNLNPNQYKDYIAGKVSQQMGRAFEIQGDLKLGYYPWLHIETSGVFLANAPGFGELPMLSADYVRVRVKTLPLLRKQLEVDTIVLKGVRVNLAKNRDGIANWEDLGGKAEKQPPQVPVEKDKGFDLANLAVLLQGGLDIRDVAFSFDDQAAEEIYTLSDLNITTGRMVPGDPVDLSLSFNADAVPPEMSGNAVLKGKIFYDFNTGQYQIKPLTVQAQLAGAPLGKTTAELILNCLVELDLVKDRMAITDLFASGLDTTITGAVSLEGLGSGQPRVDMNLNVSGKDLALMFKVFEGGPLSAQLAGLPDRTFDLKTTVVADNARGSVSVPQFEANLLGAAITGAVQAEGIQTNLPSVKGNVFAKGPDLPLLLELAGWLRADNDVLTDLGRQLAKIPEKGFRADVSVDMSQGQLNVPNLEMTALGISVKADVAGRDLGTAKADIKGQALLAGKKMSHLLTALDQPDLAALLDTVDLTARFRGNYQDLVVDPLQVKVGLSGKQIPNPPVFVTLDAPVQLQLEKDVLDLAGFSLKGLDLDLSGNLSARQIRTAPEYGGHLSVARFNLRDLMKKLKQPLPETSDKQVFEKVAMKTDFSGSASHIRLTRLAAVLDDTQINANLAIQDFSDPDITVDLAIDRIDADRYLPPGEKSGTGKKQTARPVTPETAAAGAAVQIPAALLRSLKLNAALAIDGLKISGAALSQVRVNVTAKDGILTKAPLSANLYQGTYNGKVVLDVTGDIPELAMDTALKGVQVEPLLMDMTGNNPIRGNGDITAALTTRGLDVDAMKQNLNGNLSFSFKNGAVKGFNVGKFLRSLKSLRESRTFAVSEQEETDFTELTGNPVVTNGVVVLDDLSGKSPALRVAGKGIVVDIVRQTIDYKAIITVVETSKGQAGSDLAELAGLPVSIYIRGPLTDPAIQPDIKGVITSILTGTSPEAVEQLKQSVEKELGRFLKKLSN